MKVILSIKKPNLLNALARKKESMSFFLCFSTFFLWAFSIWALDESNGPTTDLFGLIHGPNQIQGLLYCCFQKREKGGRYLPINISILILGVVLDLHAELYKSVEAQERDTCYLIVLTTNGGVIKLDMMDDYARYKTWATTIQHMLMLSTSVTRYELQF